MAIRSRPRAASTTCARGTKAPRRNGRRRRRRRRRDDDRDHRDRRSRDDDDDDGEGGGGAQPRQDGAARGPVPRHRDRVPEHHELFRSDVIDDMPMLQVLEESSKSIFVPLTVKGGGDTQFTPTRIAGSSTRRSGVGEPALPVGEQTNLQINPPRSRSRSPTCVSQLQVNGKKHVGPKKESLHNKRKVTFKQGGPYIYPDRPEQTGHCGQQNHLRQ